MVNKIVTVSGSASSTQDISVISAITKLFDAAAAEGNGRIG